MTTTLTSASAPPATPDAVPPTLQGRPGIPLTRLVVVELRKLVNTRAGRWLLISTGGLTLLAVVAFLIWGEAQEVRFADLLGLASLPLVILLPILGIMTATAEWSQRTGLVTFALEPHRGRVVLAKVIAAVVLGLVVVVVAFAGSAAAYAMGTSARGISPVWSVDIALAGGLTIALIIFILQGLAFGWVFLNTPVAIVSSLLLPTLFSILGSLIASIERVAVWLDLSRVTEPLMTGVMTGTDWAHLGTASAVWLGIPLAIGIWRVMTKEIA